MTFLSERRTEPDSGSSRRRGSQKTLVPSLQVAGFPQLQIFLPIKVENWCLVSMRVSRRSIFEYQHPKSKTQRQKTPRRRAIRQLKSKTTRANPSGG